MPIALPTPIPPWHLREIMVLYGYKQILETKYNWVMSRDDDDEPLILPKIGDLVSVEVMEAAFTHTGMNLGTYFALKGLTEGAGPNLIQ